MTTLPWKIKRKNLSVASSALNGFYMVLHKTEDTTECLFVGSEQECVDFTNRYE